MGPFGNIPAEGLDFEGHQCVRLFEGDYREAKQIMSLLDAEDVPNRMAIPEEGATLFTVVIEVMRHWLPQARRLMTATPLD